MNMTASVLLITYNHAPYVAQAIDSALAQQTDFTYEIVIGDDCSTDGTRQIVVAYQQRFPDRIRVVLPERNLGADGNRLFLEILAACQGRYVAFLDGDDYWTRPDKLQRQVDFLDAHPACAMCFHNVSVSHEGGGPEPYPFNAANQKEISTLEDLLPGNVIQTCSAMVRGEPFRRVPAWLATIPTQDWAIYLLAASHGTVGYINEVMAVYRRHGGAVWHGRGSGYYLENAIRFYETVAPHLEPRHQAIMREELSRRYYDLSRVREAEGNWPGAAACLATAMAGRPAWMETYVPGIGAKGRAIWRILARQRWLWRWPAARGLLRRSRPWLRHVRWRLNVAGIAAVRRLSRERCSGSLSVDANPVLSPGAQPVAITLSWTSTGTEAIEVRLDSPNGLCLAESGPSGSLTTGKWVTDGMCFFLQNVSGRKPLTLAHALDAVRIGVQTGDRGQG